MRVKIYDVRIPDTTTRFFQVPEYDIPILRRLWASNLKPDAFGNRAEIQVFDSGVVEFRALYHERLRLARDYNSQPDGARAPAWQCVYPTERDFNDAHAEAVEKCTAEAEANAAAAAKPKAAATAAASTVEAPSVAAPKRGRRRKADLFQPAMA
jgi:hypothetical protein